jgi:alkylhydroperoxidase family enzyme
MKSIAIAFYLMLSALSAADESTLSAPDRPAPVITANRGLMLEMLENSKKHQPRIPMPEPTATDRENAKKSQLGLVHNGLMRRYYLPEAWSTAAFPGRSAQTGLVDYAFKTELFWIISRLNNCAYCLGHQEAKLAAAGLTEKQIAALDSDWPDADTATRAARRLAVLKTNSPHQPLPAAIWPDLKTKFNDEQIGEILLTIANYNAMNRWTGPLNIPQEEHRDYKTGLSEEAVGKSSMLVGQSGRSVWAKRELPSFDAFLNLVKKPEKLPRLPIGKAASQGQPGWRILLESQGTLGQARLKSWLGAISREESPEVAIPAKIRGQIIWQVARLDNAPEVAAEARAILHSLGMTDDDLKQLEKPAGEANRDEKTEAILRYVRLVTMNPAWVADEEINQLRKHFGDRGAAQVVEVACIAAAMDRIGP